MKNNFATKNISRELAEKLLRSLQSIKGYGSMEVYVQKGNVTQISVRQIEKTDIKNSNGDFENLRT